MKTSLLLPKNHVFLSLQRGRLFLGCDREMIMTLLLICIALSITVATPLILGASGILLILGFIALRRVALEDSLWRHVYLRSLRYRRHYEGKAHLGSQSYLFKRGLYLGKRRINPA